MSLGNDCFSNIFYAHIHVNKQVQIIYIYKDFFSNQNEIITTSAAMQFIFFNKGYVLWNHLALYLNLDIEIYLLIEGGKQE